MTIYEFDILLLVSNEDDNETQVGLLYLGRMRCKLTTLILY